MTEYLNCWDLTSCGRGPGGNKISEFGVCPAVTNSILDGLNNGDHGGRICWSVAGTFCEGSIRGTFAQKRMTCLNCGVFKQIREEEGLSFILLPPQMMTEMGNFCE